MRKTCAILLSIASAWQVVWAQQSDQTNPAGLSDLCLVEPLAFPQHKLMEPGHVKVQARRTEILERQVALFSGNVDIISDSAIIHAEQAQINDNGRNLLAKGDVIYQDGRLQVKSDSVAVDSKKQQLEMVNTQYQLTGFSGHGAAQNIQLNNNEGLVLQEVTFTTCPQGEEDWALRASEISIERDSLWGKARNTRFYVGDVPVFYLPYFAFPVSNQRQTGLLFPEISSSDSTGLDYEQPFYWNIAPNYDLTVSPRAMTDRGIQLKTEFRYLTTDSTGQVNLEYLPNDKDLADSADRYFYRFFHEGQLNENWVMGINVNGISDDNYFVDLGSDFYNRADTHLYRTVGLNYYSPNLTLDMHVRDFVTIGDHPDTYRALPEARLWYTNDLGNLFEFKLHSELAYFDNTLSSQPTAVRWHLAPTVALPYQRHWGELTAELTALNTYYQQDNIEGTQLEDEVNRTLGQARFFGSLYFERAKSWFNDDMSMTLEPKIQYLYTSYEDQSNIGFYDSAPLLMDVEGLFRGQEFTGLDRISDNNQVTVGLTSRTIDSSNREQFVLSLGQIFYLDDNRVIAATKSENRSALAAELDWRLDSRWYFHTDLQIATKTDKVERSSVSLEYRHSENSLIQLTHRYVRDLSGETIDQAGLSASWPLGKNWHWVGRVYQDLERNRSIETYMGLQYESCCWAVRVVAQRHLSNRYEAGGFQTTDEYDSGVALQFIFKGIGSTKSNRSMLEDGMFGYRQPYSLN